MEKTDEKYVKVFMLSDIEGLLSSHQWQIESLHLNLDEGKLTLELKTNSFIDQKQVFE